MAGRDELLMTVGWIDQPRRRTRSHSAVWHRDTGVSFSLFALTSRGHLAPLALGGCKLYGEISFQPPYWTRMHWYFLPAR